MTTKEIYEKGIASTKQKIAECEERQNCYELAYLTALEEEDEKMCKKFLELLTDTEQQIVSYRSVIETIYRALRKEG